MSRWLTADELNSWFKLVGVMIRLNPALDSQLQRDSDMTHFDYLCLAMLSEQDEFTMPMSVLAERTNASLSRLSHVITKLENRGWVCRNPSPQSRRVTLVTMTEQGYDVLVGAAPGHVQHVIDLVFAGMSDRDVEDLRRIMGGVLERVENFLGVKQSVPPTGDC